jgi:hypothetical protein
MQVALGIDPDRSTVDVTDFGRVWGAKTVFTPEDHPDLQAEASADAPDG